MLLRVLRSGFIVDPAIFFIFIFLINVFIAAILLGFYAMLRVSEFTNQLVGRPRPLEGGLPRRHHV